MPFCRQPTHRAHCRAPRRRRRFRERQKEITQSLQERVQQLTRQLDDAGRERRRLEDDNISLRRQLEAMDKTFRPLLSAHLNALGINIDGVSMSHVAHLIDSAAQL